MKKKTIRRICLIVVIALALAFVVNQMRWRKTLMKCPAPSLAWGMYRSEVVERLGLSAEDAAGGPSDSIWLEPEQLGWDPAEAWGIPALPDESGRGRIRLSFQKRADSADGRLYLISFSVFLENGDQLMKALRPLYNAPAYWCSRKDWLMGYWFCFPEGTTSTLEEAQRCGYSGRVERGEIYPQLYIKNDQQNQGENCICSVRFMAGPINFPAGEMRWSERMIMRPESEETIHPEEGETS